MLGTFQSAPFAACLGGGLYNESDYQSDKIGLSADNPEPEHNNRKGLLVALLLLAAFCFIGYEIGTSIAVQEDEVMPERICQADTENNVTIQTISGKNSFVDGHMVTTIDLVLSDGSVNDSIHFEKSF
ncbi:MAG: hypothetical protein VZR95_06430 [Alphaproteobacteria bacterium]